jgi:hypothetical protein
VEAIQIKLHDRVLIARRPPIPGQPMTGTAVARRFSPSGEAVISVVLDAPTKDGRAVVDCLDQQLLILPPAPRGGRGC